MIDPLEELEEELGLLQPVRPSPTLKKMVARRLAEKETRSARHSAHWVFWVGGAAAACLLIAVVVWQGRTTSQPSQPADIPPWGAGLVEASPQPTLLAYKMAARESPEALEALLDKQDERLLPEPPLIPVSRFTALLDLESFNR